MKTYICDSCGRVMSNPYRENMKEFYVDFFAHEGNGVLPCNCKRKVKIHLCENCYRGLYSIAEKVRSENNV